MCVSFRLCASKFGQAVCNLFPLTSNPPTYLNLVIQLEYYRGQGPGLGGPDLVYCDDFNQITFATRLPTARGRSVHCQPTGSMRGRIARHRTSSACGCRFEVGMLARPYMPVGDSQTEGPSSYLSLYTSGRILSGWTCTRTQPRPESPRSAARGGAPIYFMYKSS